MRRLICATLSHTQRHLRVPALNGWSRSLQPARQFGVKSADYIQQVADADLTAPTDDFSNIEWRFRNGDYVSEGEVLASIEQSKAVFDLTAPTSGYLAIYVDTGGSGKAGTRVGSVRRNRAAAGPKTLKYGFVTVKDKDRAVVWKKSGVCQVIEGPARKLIWGERVEPLRHYIIDSKAYLVVDRQDGTTENVPGPTSLWFDPLVHRAVSVKRAIMLDANEALVVYFRDSTISRRVIYGPTVFFPKANEWIHNFKWGRPSSRHPDANKFFSILRTLPDKMDVEVRSGRTVDAAELTVQLMVFLQLEDVGLLLDTTHDPLQEIQIAITADLIKFVSQLTLEQYRARTGDLNDLGNFPQTLARAKAIGYRVDKITFRGTQYSAQIEKMLRDSLDADASLKLEQHKEIQRQELADQVQKHSLERELKEKKAAFEISQCQLAIEKAQFEQARAHSLQTAKAELDYLQSLGGLGVDLTQYLVAKNRKLDKDIRVSGNSDSVPVHLHLGSTK